MEQLPGALLQQVLSKVDASDCARAACVSRLWRVTAYEDNIWKHFCHCDFSISSHHDTLGSACSSFKAAYEAWKKEFQLYPTSLVSRTKRCWDRLGGWMQEHFHEIAESLAPGASQQELEETESSLGRRLPTSARLLYRLCNGQKFSEEFVTDEPTFVGLMGGYNFGRHFVNVHLLSLRQVQNMTHHILPRLQLPQDSRRIIIAASCNLNKFFFLDCDDGNVYVGTKNLLIDGEMMLCVPAQSTEGEGELQDGMLRWLEWYAHGLETGMFRVRTDKGSRSISLYPETEPYCTVAVTRGVQVRCSGVFVPEFSRVGEEQEDSYWFSYSVRMRLLPCVHGQAAHPLVACQLSRRHWIICANGTTTEVQGEAVVGMYPLLVAGAEEFVYESCTGLSAKTGSLDGDFTFVPGKLSRPEGATFNALVARFPLQVPQFIY